MKKKFIVVAIPFLITFCILGFVPANVYTPYRQYNSDSLSGEQLARLYCNICHKFPEPNLLDKPTWKEHVLPNMGWRLGVRKKGENPYKDIEQEEAELMKALKVYPNQPLISEQNWNKIVAYYLQNSPREPLPQKNMLSFDSVLKNFHTQSISFAGKALPQTSLIKFDTTASLLYIGDAQHTLYVMRKDLSMLAVLHVESPPVDLCFGNGYPRILCIGSINPSEKKQGSFYYADTITNLYSRFDKLARPVCIKEMDINGDGKKDILICQFGNYTGRLSWYDAGDPRKEHVLKLQPGAIHAEVKDMNNDGLPDIVALFAQAREQLVVFMNKGRGRFEEKIIYEFPPVYGCNYFELADFNKDGHPDILMTNGDNWDLSPIHKNYHGIRILMNDGKNNFSVKKFIPLYGACKAVARDFDHDGDLDIAAISFYDDPEDPAHAFLYLENKGNLAFSPFYSPDAGAGKWLTMEVADVNHDGYDDIVLGSFIYSMGELTKLAAKGVEHFPQAIILWNDHKQE